MVDVMITKSYFMEDTVIDGSVTYHKRVVERFDDIELAEAIDRIGMEGLRFEGETYAYQPDGSDIVDYATAERVEISGVILYAEEWEVAAIHAGVDAPRTRGWQARLHPGIEAGTYYPDDADDTFKMWTV